MTPRSNDRLIVIIDRLALLVVLAVALILPLGFAGVGYRNLVFHVETVAQVKAGEIAALAASDEGLGPQQGQRIAAVLARYPTPLDDELASAFDANGALLASAGMPPAPPLLQRSHVLYGAGRAIGRVEVAHSLRGLIYGTALAALVGLLLGGAVYGVFRAWPLRMLRRMRVALDAEHGALRESEERFRTLIEWMPEAVGVHRSGKLIYVNPAAIRILGATSAQDLIGKPILDLVHPDFHQIVQARTTEFFEKGVSAPMAAMKFLKLDGTAIDVEVQSTSIVDNGVLAVHTVLRDITERKRAEVELRTLSRAMEQSPTSIIITNRAGLIDYVNPRFEQASGYTSAEVIGRNPRLLQSGKTPPEVYEQLWAAIAVGGEWRGEICNRRKNGELYWEFAAISGVRGESGEIEHYIAVKEDITERKHAEVVRASLEAQLRESQKMQAIGTLAGGIAHDFNNALATILGNVELARQDASANPLVLESLEEIRKAAARARGLVQQILSFSRRQPTERKLIALGPLVEESARLLRATLPSRLVLEVRCDADVPPVLADATQIEQVLINLATNAMQALRSGPGHIGIRLDTVVLDASWVAAHPALHALHVKQPGRTVRLAVSDDGPGMDPATLERIFEPFFTTKQVNEGTGLGLSVVHGIVQTHEGAIEVDSESGKGATFTLYFSAAGAPAGTAAPGASVVPQAPAARADCGPRLLDLDGGDAGRA